MALAHDSLPVAAPPFSPTSRIRLIGLTLALGYLVVLGGTFLKGDFLLDRERRPIANDFVNVVAAGPSRARLQRGRRLRLAHP
jgi:hypothetical protein